MKYLFNYIDCIIKAIKTSSGVLLLLDYDGTLTSIVKKPELAKLKEQNCKLLKKLSKKFTLGIISGRSLKDIKNLLKVSGIVYAGNHGLEIEFKNKKYILPSVKKFYKLLNNIAGELKGRLGGIHGVIVEHKGVTLSLHYRCVSRSLHGKVRRMFNNIVRPYKERGKIRLTSGKKVFEVRPKTKWDKGRAVNKIRSEVGKKNIPIYIGDDVTDEDAFKVLENTGITIYVGRPRKSNANFFVWNVDEVVKFLNILNEI